METKWLISFILLLLAFLRCIGGDLIAMATRSRKGIAHIIHGSITENVVNHSDKPVWTYTLRNEPDYDFNVEGTLIAYES